MSHQLLRLRESLFNTPLLVDTETFNSVATYLNDRNAGRIEIVAEDGDDRQGHGRFLYNEDTQTAVMHIEGPITYRPITFMGMDCGGANYIHLKQDVEDAIQMGAKTIAWMVDSGGGHAHQMTDSGAYIRRLLDENGVRLLSYVDGRAASAAYGLACISDEIIATKDSELGSIGVLVELYNDSEALEKQGYERTFIYKGDEKIPFDSDGSWREGYLEQIKEKVEICYEDFVGHVAKHRNISTDAVRSTQARMYFASDAVELGLADKVMTPEEFYGYLADEAQRNMTGDGMQRMPRIFQFQNKEETTVTLAELQAKVDELVQANADLNTQLEAAVTSATSFETSLATMAAENEKLAEALAAKADALEALQAEQAEMKTSARKSALSAVVAEERVEGLMARLSVLSDEDFAATVEDFRVAKAATEASEMLQELGQDSEEADPQSADDAGDTATLAALKRLQRI